MRAYRAAILATAIGLLAVAALILLVQSGGDDSTPGPTAGPTASPTPSPTVKPTTDVELVPYFDELETIFQQASDGSVTADNARAAALDSAEDIGGIKTAYIDFLAATGAVFDAAIVAMNALEVPPAVQADHSAFITAAQSSKNLATELSTSIQGVTTEQELQALLQDFGNDNGPLLAAADLACARLQETALTHGVDVDLACSSAAR